MKKELFYELNPETKLKYAMKCLENNPDAVFWSDDTGAIAYVNSAACDELGYTREELIGMNVIDFDVNFINKKFVEIDEFVKAASKGEIVRVQTKHIHRDGHIVPVDVSMGELESEGISLGFSFARDMTKHIKGEQDLINAYAVLEEKNRELKQLYCEIKTREDQLKFLAYHDQLTGLSNRNLLMETINQNISAFKRTPEKFAVLFIDLDNFKNINDSLGHSIGDTVLIEVSKRLRNNIRGIDGVYRFGGDEFIVLVQDVPTQAALQEFAQMIKNCLLDPFHLEMTSIYLTCSIGVSVFPDDANAAEELLMFADAAMYRAKSEGKNHVHFFSGEMKQNAISKIDLQNRLRFALDRQEFFLEYQPQYDMITGQCRGVEALIRWANPTLGVISPVHFIPAAEEMGFIVPIGKWVLMQACEAARRWGETCGYDGIISVNISGYQLKNAGFVQDVKEALVISGLNPRRLELEITESMFITSFETTVPKLMELKNLGVRICLDDFGTGYSSLGYLMQLPVDTLKIDKAFIGQIASGSNQKHIIGSIIALVNDLGIETVIEGVETVEQFEYLRTTKSDYLQGYLFSRPVKEEVIMPLFQTTNLQQLSWDGVISLAAIPSVSSSKRK